MLLSASSGWTNVRRDKVMGKKGIAGRGPILVHQFQGSHIPSFPLLLLVSEPDTTRTRRGLQWSLHLGDHVYDNFPRIRIDTNWFGKASTSPPSSPLHAYRALHSVSSDNGAFVNMRWGLSCTGTTRRN